MVKVPNAPRPSQAPLPRGQRSKAKKIKEKYADQANALPVRSVERLWEYRMIHHSGRGRTRASTRSSWQCFSQITEDQKRAVSGLGI